MKGHLLNFWIRVVSCVLETSNPKRAKWGLQRVNPTANQIPSWGEKLTIYKQQTNWPGAQPFAGDCVWPQAGRMRSAGTGKQLQSYWNHRCVRGGHKEPSSQNPEKEQRILAGIRRPSHGWDSAPVNSTPLTPLRDWMPGFPLVSGALTGVKRGSLSLERCTGCLCSIII